MLIDFVINNYTGIYLLSILLFVFVDNKYVIYYIFILDIIFNRFPFISLLFLLIKYLNKYVFRLINNNFINRYIMIIIYYFIFSIVLYSIFNKFNLYIIKYLVNNIIYNLIYYYIGLKILEMERLDE